MSEEHFNTETCMKLLNLLLMYRTMAQMRNRALIQQLGELSKTTQEATYVTLDNVVPA